MRTPFRVPVLPLVLAATGLLLASGCRTSTDGGGNTNPNGTPSLAAFTQSACMQNDAAGAAATGARGVVTANPHHNYIRVEHAGVAVACEATVSFEVRARGTTLVLAEKVTGGRADCSCPVNVATSILNLVPGTTYELVVQNGDATVEYARLRITLPTADSPTQQCRAAYDCADLGLAHAACDGGFACESAHCVWVCEGALTCNADADCLDGFRCRMPRCDATTGDAGAGSTDSSGAPSPRQSRCGGPGYCEPSPMQCALDADCARFPMPAAGADPSTGAPLVMCRGAYHCIAGACEYDCEPTACASNADCPADWHCEQFQLGMPCGPEGCPANPGRCVPNAIVDCRTDADCGAGRYCAFDVPVPMPADDPATGTSTSPRQAQGGVCRDRPQYTCRVPSDCRAYDMPVPACVGFFTCNTGLCGFECSRSCRANADCPRGQVCERAVRADGTTEPGGMCRPANPDPGACATDRDCPAGQFCAFLGGEPVPLDPNDAPGQTRPATGRCIDRPAGCMSDADCAAGEMCVAAPCAPPDPTTDPDEWYCPNVCVPTTRPYCGSDADCDAGFHCEFDGMTPGDPGVPPGDPAGPANPADETQPMPAPGRCVPNSTSGECDTDADCARGYQCIPTPCAPPPEDMPDYRCPSYCVPRQNEGCMTDNDCALGSYCEAVECPPNADCAWWGVCKPMAEICGGFAGAECREGFWCDWQANSDFGYCRPLGTCDAAPDCVNQPLPHPMCVGAWTCVSNQCAWRCGEPDPCMGAWRDASGLCRGPADGVLPEYCCGGQTCSSDRECAYLLEVGDPPMNCVDAKPACVAGACGWACGTQPFACRADTDCREFAAVSLPPPDCASPRAVCDAATASCAWACDAGPSCMGAWLDERGTCRGPADGVLPPECCRRVDCSPARIQCRMMEPVCPAGQAASVVPFGDGTCWGPCVPVERCAPSRCDANTRCPTNFTCGRDGLCRYTPPACTGSTDCVCADGTVGSCWDGLCVCEGPNPERCRSNADCGMLDCAGIVACVEGACRCGEAPPLECGGFVGAPCPAGQWCDYIPGTDYGLCRPEANACRSDADCANLDCMGAACVGGVCMCGLPQAECGTSAGIACPEGFWCDGADAPGAAGVCREVGTCDLPADCDGQPIGHIECVGHSTCERGRCGYVCDTNPLACRTDADCPFACANSGCYDGVCSCGAPTPVACGGIAGFPCPAGQWCDAESFPDAMGVCRPLGRCSDAADCEGQGLVHDMCVGAWTCARESCAWVCGR